MAYPLIVKPDAEADIREAINWYNQQSPGLGYKFLDRLDHALARIARTPEIHAIAYRNARLTLIRKFPYVLCYLFENETVYVLAVFHGHRDPSVWKNRLDD